MHYILVYTGVGILILGFPSLWLIAELKDKPKKIRCFLGTGAILSSFGVAWLAAQLIRIEYNISYSKSSTSLVKSVIGLLERGHIETVLRELKILDNKFPNWSHTRLAGRAHYDQFLNEVIKRMDEQASANQSLDTNGDSAGAPSP